MNLNVVQAALGDTVHVPTVHGDVDLVIPEGTQTVRNSSASVVRAPSLRGGSVGDQYMYLCVGGTNGS